MQKITTKALQAFCTLVEWYPHGFSDKGADQRISQKFVDEYIATLETEKQVGIGGSYWTFLMTWRMLGWIEPTHKGWAYTECGRYVATMADLFPVDPPVENAPYPDADMNVFSTTLPIGTPYIDFVLCGESTREVDLQLDLVLDEPPPRDFALVAQESPLHPTIDWSGFDPELMKLVERFGLPKELLLEVDEITC